MALKNIFIIYCDAFHVAIERHRLQFQEQWSLRSLLDLKIVKKINLTMNFYCMYTAIIYRGHNCELHVASVPLNR